MVPAVIERTITDKSLPYDVTMVLTFQKDRYELAELRFEQRKRGGPVAGVKLRQVPVDRLVRQVMREFLPVYKRGRLIRRRGVVSLYRVAYALHLPPTATVAECLNMTQGAAEQAVISARRAGALPATEQGRAKG